MLVATSRTAFISLLIGIKASLTHAHCLKWTSAEKSVCFDFPFADDYCNFGPSIQARVCVYRRQNAPSWAGGERCSQEGEDISLAEKNRPRTYQAGEQLPRDLPGSHVNLGLTTIAPACEGRPAIVVLGTGCSAPTHSLHDQSQHRALAIGSHPSGHH